MFVLKILNTATYITRASKTSAAHVLMTLNSNFLNKSIKQSSVPRTAQLPTTLKTRHLHLNGRPVSIINFTLT